jgi:hypothetical protein
MIGWNVPIERKLIEQSSLFDLPISHHDSVLSQRLNQRASARATEDFFNEIGQWETSAVPRPDDRKVTATFWIVRVQTGAASIMLTVEFVAKTLCN